MVPFAGQRPLSLLALISIKYSTRVTRIKSSHRRHKYCRSANKAQGEEGAPVRIQFCIYIRCTYACIEPEGLSKERNSENATTECA